MEKIGKDRHQRHVNMELATSRVKSRVNRSIATEPVQLLWCWILQTNGTQEIEKFGKHRHQSHNLIYNYIACDLSRDLLRK